MDSSKKSAEFLNPFEYNFYFSFIGNNRSILYPNESMETIKKPVQVKLLLAYISRVLFHTPKELRPLFASIDSGEYNNCQKLKKYKVYACVKGEDEGKSQIEMKNGDKIESEIESESESESESKIKRDKGILR